MSEQSNGNGKSSKDWFHLDLSDPITAVGGVATLALAAGVGYAINEFRSGRWSIPSLVVQQQPQQPPQQPPTPPPEVQQPPAAPQPPVEAMHPPSTYTGVQDGANVIKPKMAEPAVAEPAGLKPNPPASGNRYKKVRFH